MCKSRKEHSHTNHTCIKEPSQIVQRNIWKQTKHLLTAYKKLFQSHHNDICQQTSTNQNGSATPPEPIRYTTKRPLPHHSKALPPPRQFIPAIQSISAISWIIYQNQSTTQPDAYYMSFQAMQNTLRQQPKHILQACVPTQQKSYKIINKMFAKSV